MARYSSGITSPTRELEPSLVVTFFRNHANKFIWAAIALLAISGSILIATGSAFLAFLTAPVALMLFSATGETKRSRYEVSKQSIADALILPAYMPAMLMSVIWLVLTQLDSPVLAVICALPIPLIFMPSFRRAIRNHEVRTWNAMVGRLEIAVIENVPYASINMNSLSTTGSHWQEVEWETQRRRQETFDAWLKVDLPLQRKLDLMAGGISPEQALDPKIKAMTADDLRTLKAITELAGTPEVTAAP